MTGVPSGTRQTASAGTAPPRDRDANPRLCRHRYPPSGDAPVGSKPTGNEPTGYKPGGCEPDSYEHSGYKHSGYKHSAVTSPVQLADPGLGQAVGRHGGVARYPEAPRNVRGRANANARAHGDLDRAVRPRAGVGGAQTEFPVR